MEVKVVNKSKHNLPGYATDFAAGIDLKADTDEPVQLTPGSKYLFPTGLYIQLPEGYEAQIRPRSGLACKFGITVANAPGTIDPDYRGEVKVCLINLSKDSFVINPGERIAQMVVARFERIQWKEVVSLDESARGEGGFGSTGTK